MDLILKATILCESELAREEANTFNIDVACQSAIASKLAHRGFKGLEEVVINHRLDLRPVRGVFTVSPQIRQHRRQ